MTEETQSALPADQDSEIEPAVEAGLGSITVEDVKNAVSDPEMIAEQAEQILSKLNNLAIHLHETPRNLLDGLTLKFKGKDAVIPPGKFSEEFMKLLAQLTKETIDKRLENEA